MIRRPISVQALLRADKAPRLVQRRCWQHGLAFRLILPTGSGEYVKASGPLGFVMREAKKVLER